MVKKRLALKKKFDRRGFLIQITNPQGKGTATIIQRGGPTGFTAIGPKGRKIGFGRSAEKLALKLAKKKRIVKFSD